MTKPPALHERIRKDIERAIMSGELSPGDRIPFEHELVAQYGCSRMTVNKALSGLADAGLIFRRRRAGSFVAQPRVHMAALEIPDLRAEIVGHGQQYGLQLLSRVERLPQASDTTIMKSPDVRILAIECLHLANEKPFALESRLINLTAVPDAIGVDFGNTPPGTWLLEHVPWTEAEHRISALVTDRHSAEKLTLPIGSACLSLERWTWRGDDPITYVRQKFPADSYALLARFSAR